MILRKLKVLRFALIFPKKNEARQNNQKTSTYFFYKVFIHTSFQTPKYINKAINVKAIIESE
jgi:hypothetical protein